MAKIMLEHAKTGVVYAYCDILATHPDMRRLIVEDEQDVSPQAAAAISAGKAAGKMPARKRAAPQVETVADSVDATFVGAPAPVNGIDVDGFDE